MMQMFVLIERGDDFKAKDVGSGAARSFGRATELYKSAAAKMGPEIDNKLSDVKTEIVMAIAQTPVSNPLFSEIANTAKSAKPSSALMDLCSVEAGRMPPFFGAIGESEIDPYRIIRVGRTGNADGLAPRRGDDLSRFRLVQNQPLNSPSASCPLRAVVADKLAAVPRESQFKRFPLLRGK